jgi:predicted PurR-regulated permease PerM
MPATSSAHPPWTARRVRASGSSILLAVATIVAVVLARDLVAAASQPIGWVVAAAATALVLWPIVERLDVLLPRGLGIVVALVGTAAIAIGLFLAVSNELQGQFDQLERQLPRAAAELQERDGEDGVLARLRFSTLVRDVVAQTSERVAPEPTVSDAAGTAPAFLVSGILVIFFLIWGPKVLAGGLQQVSDPARRARVAEVAGRAARSTQGYVLTTAAAGVGAGLAGGLLAWAVGLPTPLVLGVVVGAASTVPRVGVLFGSVPLLLLAAPSEPALVVVALGLGLVGVQAAHTVAFAFGERHGLLRAGPAVVVIGAMVGSDLYGLGGALVAVVAGIGAIAVIDAARPPQPST